MTAILCVKKVQSCICSTALLMAFSVGCSATSGEPEIVVAPDFEAAGDKIRFVGSASYDNYQLGELPAGENFDLFSFDARAGSQVSVEVVGDNVSHRLYPNLFLIGPVSRGEFPELARVTALDHRCEINTQIPEDGEYFAVVGAQHGQGQYQIALWCDSDSCGMNVQ